MRLGTIILLSIISFTNLHAAEFNEFLMQEGKSNKSLALSTLPKSLKPFIKLGKKPTPKLLRSLESLIGDVMRTEHTGVTVRVTVGKESLATFHTGFSKLVAKHSFPFTWQLNGKGPIAGGIGFDVRLASLAKLRREVEHNYVYKVSESDKKRIHWSLVYDLMLRSGFSVGDFRFNNAAKVRLFTLEGKTLDNNYTDIQRFLTTTLPKDIEPFHIVGFEVPEVLGFEAGDMLSHFSRMAARDSRIEARGMIYDNEKGWFYICLNNAGRQTLDLHGRKDAEGKYDGRRIKDAHEDTHAFLQDAYLGFRDTATVITGRGKHAGPHGEKGVLKKAFKHDKALAPFIKKSHPIKGDGGYHVTLPKAPCLDLNGLELKEALTQLIKATSQAKKAGHNRLRLKVEQPFGDKLLAQYTHYLVLGGYTFDFSITEAPGELRLIFAKSPVMSKAVE